MMSIKERLEFWRSLDLKKNLLVGYYEYGRRGKPYNNIQEGLMEFRKTMGALREWKYSCWADYDKIRNTIPY